MKFLRPAAFAALLVIVAAPALAQLRQAATFEFVGGPTPLTMSLETLSALPQVEQEITFKTSKGTSTARYKGPLLWDIVKSSKTLDNLERNKELAKTLLVTATDGYEIAFSIGELSPEFGNATALVALETNGLPVPEGFRIVVQGDKRGARAIHNIVKMEIR